MLLFTKGQLADTREALCQQVDDFVLTALESHFAGELVLLQNHCALSGSMRH